MAAGFGHRLAFQNLSNAYKSRQSPLGQNGSDNWRAGLHKSSRPPPDKMEVPETLSDLSYKCRFLLNKADALYNKGDFESALMYYHKGQKLRPKAQEFRLGIIKAEDALKALFTKKEQERRKEEKKKTVVRFAKPNELVKEIKDKKEEKEKNTNKPSSEKTEESSNKDKDGKEGENEAKEEKTGQDGEVTQDEKQNETETTETKDKDKSEKKNESKEDQKEKDKPTENTPIEESYAERLRKEEERKERVREARLAFGVKERKEARKIRAKYHSRPNGHLIDDIKFLNMMYRTIEETDRQNKKVKKMAKDALTYLDSRNSFWEQQLPHHIREKSLILPNRDKAMKPPPTQAMYTFMLKELMRINTMMGKSQWHRSIETAKKLIGHIGKMDRKIPDKDNAMANCFSMIGNCYLELGQEKKALAFHMKDLEIATQSDLDEAKLRALDNVGRVYARIGEFHKAIAIWEEKMASPFPMGAGERAWLYHEMGYCCIEVDDPEKAKDCGIKSHEAAVEKEDKKWQLKAKILLSQALLRLGEAVEAKDEFEKALVLAKETGDEDAQKRVEEALSELEEVLAEWDYLESEAEDSVNEDDQDQNADEALVRVATPGSVVSGSVKTKTSAASTTKRPGQADWLLVEAEHKLLEQQEGYYDMDEDKESEQDSTKKFEEDTGSAAKAPASVKSLPPKSKRPTQGSVKGSTRKTEESQKIATNAPKNNTTQKPKREKSNASLTSKPSRQNSNASLRGQRSREPSFVKPKRELSNQSLNRQGKMSREGSNVSLRSKGPSPTQQKQVETTIKPIGNRIEDTKAIYLDKGKPISRDVSNVSRKSNSKQAKAEPGKDNKNQKPSAEEQRINRHAIDSVAASNDPEKSDLGMGDIDVESTDNKAPPRETTMSSKKDSKAFITENTTLTSSTAQPRD